MFHRNQAGGYVVPAHTAIVNAMNFPAHSELGDQCQIAPGCTFGTGVTIGKNSVIGHGSKFRDHAVVGEETVICPSVSFGNNTTVHARCTLTQGVSFGSDCVFKGNLAMIGGGQRIGDRPQFEGEIASPRPFVIGINPVFKHPRPIMAVDMRSDIVCAEKS